MIFIWYSYDMQICIDRKYPSIIHPYPHSIPFRHIETGPKHCWNMLEQCHCSCLKHKGFASGLELQQDFLASCHFLEKPTGCSLACRSRETACPAIGFWSSSVWSGDTLAMWNSERGTWNKCLAVRHLPIKYTCALACEIETNGAKFIDPCSFELAPTESDSVCITSDHSGPHGLGARPDWSHDHRDVHWDQGGAFAADPTGGGLGEVHAIASLCTMAELQTNIGLSVPYSLSLSPSIPYVSLNSITRSASIYIYIINI